MAGTVFANGRSLVHKDDGSTHVAGVPDVCKTPSPGGPVPIPYPNMAMSSDLTDGTTTVKIQGAMAAHKSATIGSSSGDEPGTIGGVVSNCNRGKMAFTLYSMDVKLEGKNAVRFADLGPGNGNSYNDMFPTLLGAPNAVAYGDDAEQEVCDKCGKSQPEHRLYAYPDAVAACAKFMNKVEELSKKIIDARAAWADDLVSQLGTAQFRIPSGTNHKFVDVSKNQVGKIMAGGTKAHPDDVKMLMPLVDGMKDLHRRALAVQAEVKPYKAASRFVPGKNRMFGIVLCKCKDKPGVVPKACAAISGVGTSPTTIVAAFDHATFAAEVATLNANAAALQAYTATGAYCRPLIPTLEPPKNLELTDLMDCYDGAATAASSATVLNNGAALVAPSNAGHYFKAWTLEEIAQAAIQELNAESPVGYDWKLPPQANLGPASMPGATVTLDAEGEPTQVVWPGGAYEWDRKEDNSNAPFTCAAPKALKLCEDEGHQAWSLCEMVYLGPPGKPVTTNPRTYHGADAAEINDPSKYAVTKKVIGHKEIANHCDTCKELIAKMRCDKKDKDCP
jgi:hypothetical protein